VRYVEKMTVYYNQEQKYLTLQKSDYIEDGGYIRVEGSEYKAYEIPQYGGNPELIKVCKDIFEAIEVLDGLT
jgi:hypothetical protein